MTSLATRLSVVITSTARSMDAEEARPRLIAVVRTPIPSGLVKIKASPGRAPTLRTTREGCTLPSATNPYFGSGSSTLWPPRIATPASAALAAPPWITCSRTSSGNPSRGKFTMFRAKIGLAPMAYTSLSALAAAILPQVYGSSTTGVM